jgi:hypothetical protein
MNPNTPHAPLSPDPALIWFFDSSKQLLVFRDAASNVVAAWPENAIIKSGWKMLGIRGLPRVTVNG